MSIWDTGSFLLGDIAMDALVDLGWVLDSAFESALRLCTTLVGAWGSYKEGANVISIICCLYLGDLETVINIGKFSVEPHLHGTDWQGTPLIKGAFEGSMILREEFRLVGISSCDASQQLFFCCVVYIVAIVEETVACVPSEVGVVP